MVWLVLAALILLPKPATAQETQETQETEEAEDLRGTAKSNKVKAYVSADLVSRYMWRGMKLGHVSLQPEAGIAWRGLSLSAMGSVGIEKDDAEKLDLTLQYQRWGVKIGVTDYWTTGNDPDDRYFYYDAKKGNHQFEGFLGYECKYGSITAYTMFYGYDWKINGNRAYSTFIELNVPFYLAGIDWDVSVGITPFESAGYVQRIYFDTAVGQQYVDRKEYFYGNGFTCNMASIRATKRLKLGDVKTPVFVELHTNPYLQKANLVLGVSVEPF